MKNIFFIITCLSMANLCWSQSFSIYDNFDDYKAGEYLGTESNDLWTTWTLNPGTTEDVVVTDDNSYSPDNSINLVSGAVTDVVLPLGDLNSGSWTLKYMMLIEAGNGAYFNLLHDFNAGNSNWAVQVYFNSNGAGTLAVGSQINDPGTAFTHPVGSWFEIKIDINIDSNVADLYFDDALVYSWDWSEGSVNASSTIAALNLYPNGMDGEPDSYFVDDVSFTEYGVGLSELENSISIFPNPVNHHFTVMPTQKSEIQIFNLIGSKVYTQLNVENEFVIDCSAWKSGIYLLRLTGEDGSVQQSKLIVE